MLGAISKDHNLSFPLIRYFTNRRSGVWLTSRSYVRTYFTPSYRYDKNTSGKNETIPLKMQHHSPKKN